MNIIYPNSIVDHKKIDEHFMPEVNKLKNDHTILSFNTLNKDGNGEKLLYRGWMLHPEEYKELTTRSEKYHYQLITHYDQYYSSHHMNRWYHLVQDLTPKTCFFDDLEMLKSQFETIPFNSPYFLKDSVKSLTTTRGSVAYKKEDVIDIIKQISFLKGLEGVISVREYHNFVHDSEIRYFSIYGRVFSPNQSISPLAIEIGERFKHLPFISIDVIQDVNGKEWLVEIGDGQVSDLKMWNLDDFSNMILNLE